MFGFLGTFLNLVFPADWLGWDWSAQIWNNIWLIILSIPLALISFVAMIFFGLMLVIPIILITLMLIIVLIGFGLAGPLLGLFVLLMVVLILIGMVLGGLTGPTLTFLWLFYPFDKPFIFWLIILVLMLWVDVVSPLFGVIV